MMDFCSGGGGSLFRGWSGEVCSSLEQEMVIFMLGVEQAWRQAWFAVLTFSLVLLLTS